MRWVLALVLVAAGCSAAAWAAVSRSDAGQDQTVVLVHGLGRSRASMLVLGLRFRRAGYEVRYYPYTPATTSVEEVARGLHDFVARRLASEEFYAELPVPGVPFGVIAGNRGRTPGLASPNDGVLEVEDTRLAGMADLRPLSSLPPTTSPGAYAVLRRMMAKRREDRFASYEELIRALESC